MTPNNRHAPTKKPNSVWSLVMMAVVFIVFVAMILYFFVFQPGLGIQYDPYTDAQIEITGRDDSTKEVNAAKGEFYVLLNDKEVNKLQVQKSAATDKIYYVMGEYKEDNKKKGFKGSFNEHSYEAINFIIKSRKDGDGNPYYNAARYVYDVQSTNSIWSWLLPLLYIVIICVLGYFVLRSLSRSMGSQNQIMTFNQSRAKRETQSKTRFSDVAGCDEVIDELREVVEYFHSNEKYKKIGATLPKGILLVGPPGTGKTLLAKAVAGEASVPFYSISGSDFVEMYVGVGAGRVRDMFNVAKHNAPCLIFIDEIDAVGRQRGAGMGGGNDEREQTLNQLLVEMDGFADNSGIIVMAATNRSDVLDPALLRPGRFDRTVTVDLPDRQGREQIFKVHSHHIPLAEDVDFSGIAGRTVGFSGADIANVMNEAAILAVRNRRDRVTMPDIDEAIDRRIAGPAKKTHMEEEDKRQVAFHEAGHAIIGLVLPGADTVQAVSIIPRGRTGGHTLMSPDKDRFLYTKQMLIARITGYLGGRVSEQVFFGDVSTGASDDFEKATRIARSMVTEYGMSDLGPIQYENPNRDVFLGRDYNNLQRNFSAQVAYEIDQEERKIIEGCYREAEKIVKGNKAKIELIAKALMEKETITAPEIKYLLAHKKLPNYEKHVSKTKPTDPFKDYKPKNPGKITLISEYASFYHQVDDLMANGIADMVICSFSAESGPMDPTAFRQEVLSVYPSGKTGIIFIERTDLKDISAPVETVVQHLEKYAGYEMLLITTTEGSVHKLKSLVNGFEEDKKGE